MEGACQASTLDVPSPRGSLCIQCDPVHPCRVEPIVAWAEAVWDEQLDDADLRKAWRRQQRLVGLKPSWSKVSGPTGAIIMCMRQLGWTWPHHTTFVTASGHEMDLRQTCHMDVKAQCVDSELALWREWADNDERRELLPCPLLEPVILANKRAQRRPQEAPAIKDGVGCDPSWMARIAEHPFCLKCGPAVLGLAQHRLWACPAYRETRFDHPPTHQHRDRPRLATNSSGREA